MMMNKSIFDSVVPSSTSNPSVQPIQITDLNEHLMSVAAAHDMLSFLRSSTHELSHQDEGRSPSFYRGLSLCIELVQQKLEHGLSRQDQAEP